MNRIIFTIIIIIFLLATGYAIVRHNNQAVDTESIVLSGSTSGITLMEPILALFRETYPDIEIVIVPGSSTGDGVRGVSEGLLDIGIAARAMKDSEREQYTNVQAQPFIHDAMVLAVHPSVTVDRVTSEEVIGIHEGTIADWSELGGAPGTIVVLDREESESSKILLREAILGNDLVIRSDATLLISSGSMNEALQTVQNTIGQTSLGVISLQELNIKPLTLDGVTPSPNTIMTGRYPMVREYSVLVSNTNVNPAVSVFTDFLKNESVQAVLREHNMEPI